MSDIPSDRLREDAEGVSSFRTFEPEDVGDFFSGTISSPTVLKMVEFLTRPSTF